VALARLAAAGARPAATTIVQSGGRVASAASRLRSMNQSFQSLQSAGARAEGQVLRGEGTRIAQSAVRSRFVDYMRTAASAAPRAEAQVIAGQGARMAESTARVRVLGEAFRNLRATGSQVAERTVAASNAGVRLASDSLQVVRNPLGYMQGVLNGVTDALAQNPRLALSVLSKKEGDCLVRGMMFEANWGKAIERLVAAAVEKAPHLAKRFLYTGSQRPFRMGSPDFINKVSTVPMDIHPPAALAAHMARWYGAAFNMQPLHYTRPSYEAIRLLLAG
jgi:hypothetical protein